MGRTSQRQTIPTVSQQVPDNNAPSTNSAVSEAGRLQMNDPTTDDSGITNTGDQNHRTSSTASATTKESNIVLPTSSISFNTALAGLLVSDDATLDKEMIAKSIEQVPTNSGVWVPASERNDILNLLNAASAYPFTIDQDGYVHKVWDSILDSQKSLTFYNKIDTLISGQNRIILSISSSYWSFNESSHTIAKQTISNSVSMVFQNSRILILDRAHFVSKSQNAYATLAISMLKALYKDGSDCTAAVSKELSSLLGQSPSSSSDSTMPSSPKGAPSQSHSDSSSNSNQTQSNASSENSSSPQKDTGNSKTNSSPQTSSSMATDSPQTSPSVSSTPQASEKTESAPSFNSVNSSGRGDNSQDAQQDETSSKTVSSSMSAAIEKDYSAKTNIASTESTIPVPCCHLQKSAQTVMPHLLFPKKVTPSLPIAVYPLLSPHSQIAVNCPPNQAAHPAGQIALQAPSAPRPAMSVQIRTLTILIFLKPTATHKCNPVHSMLL